MQPHSPSFWLNIISSVTLLFLSILLSSCTPQPQPIEFGSDACHNCKMTIVDKRYGAELITKKGKVYKFDAIECLVRTVYRDNITDESNIHSLLTIDYGQPAQLISAETAVFLHSKNLPSPMGMFLTAFSKKEDAATARETHSGNLVDWNEAKKIILTNKLPD